MEDAKKICSLSRLLGDHFFVQVPIIFLPRFSSRLPHEVSNNRSKMKSVSVYFTACPKGLRQAHFISERYFERKYVSSVFMNMKLLTGPVYVFKMAGALVAESGGEPHAVQTLRAAWWRPVVGSSGHPACRRAAGFQPGGMNRPPTRGLPNIFLRRWKTRPILSGRRDASPPRQAGRPTLRRGPMPTGHRAASGLRLLQHRFRSWLQVDSIFADNFH